MAATITAAAFLSTPGPITPALAAPLFHERRPPPLDNATRVQLQGLTLDRAVALAAQRNPDILHQLQEIERLQGVYIQVRADELPHLAATGSYTVEDKSLLGGFSAVGITGSSSGTTGTTTTGTGTGGTTTPVLGSSTGTTTTTGSATGTTTSTTTTGGTTIGTTTTGTTGSGATSTTTPVTTTGTLLGPTTAAKLARPITRQAGDTTGTTGTTTGVTSSGVVSEDNKSYVVELQLSQNLFAPGVYHQVRAAQLTEGNAFFQLRETVDTTILNVRTGFYQVLEDEALISVQEESVRLLESQLKDQENRFAAGTVPRFNVLQAQVALGNQRPQLIAAENAYQLAKLNLARLIGVDSDPMYGKIADFHCVGKLIYEPRTFDIQKAVDAAVTNRAILKLDKQSIRIQEENIHAALSGYLPTVTGTAGLLQRSTTDLDHNVSGWIVGVQGNWNIFDGLSTYGQVRQARATRFEAITTYDDAVRQVSLDVQNAYQNILQAKQLVASQVLNVQEAEEAVRLAQARLQAGAGVQLDVLNAQVQLATAESTEIQARFSYVVAVATMERVTGTSTFYQDNFKDPLTRAKKDAPVPITSRTTRTVSKGDTPSTAITRQSEERRAQGLPDQDKIDAERAGRQPPPTTHFPDNRPMLSGRPSPMSNDSAPHRGPESGD